MPMGMAASACIRNRRTISRTTKSSTCFPPATHSQPLIQTMTKFKLGVAGVVVVAGILASLAIQHRTHVRLRERDEALRQQAEILASLTAENQRLAQLVEQTKSAQPLSQDQLRE